MRDTRSVVANYERAGLDLRAIQSELIGLRSSTNPQAATDLMARLRPPGGEALCQRWFGVNNVNELVADHPVRVLMERYMAASDLQADKAALFAATQANSDAGPVKSSVVSAWTQTGIGAFAHLVEPPATQISYPITNGVQYVVVSTSITANPFLTIPFIPGVPGLSAPMTFTFSSKRVLEDPSNAGK